MKLKLALASLIASTLALPALAQMSPSTTGSAGTWYIVQDPSTKRCEITSLNRKQEEKRRPSGGVLIHLELKLKAT